MTRTGTVRVEIEGTVGGIRRSLQLARIAEADAYLGARTGTYERRCVRYDAALDAMHDLGLGDSSTVVDVGAGWCELGVRLHTGHGSHHVWRGAPPDWDRPLPRSRARYIPVDACIDGVDLNHWVPPRRAEFFVALEIIEHLDDPIRLLTVMQQAATKAVIVSTPNPATTDVLGMDATHRTPVHANTLALCGFDVTPAEFYGKPEDSLFAVWRAP